MKFFTPLLTLVAAGTIYANGITDLLNNLNKRDNVETECDTREITDCITSPTVNSQEYLCQKIKSDICQKFYADPFGVLPSCKNDTIFSKLFQPIVVNSTKQQYNLICQKDEAGNICPYGEILLKEYSKVLNPISDKQREELLKSTCQSKYCREATYRAFADYDEARRTVKEATPGVIYNPKDNIIYIGKQEVAKYMDTDECKAMSDASTLKISTGFFISIGLLLLSLY
ncbi:hypothetical protein PIROE2DRAFT_10219 [Piromyces sp. E2]|nr:hypothetical protein PIROE2DRAFT_10219 [Piromyces sp. E2]|eukprot:OUM63254.1 hypothetical protein PIROE2DRAFT_10219 [Piromyces sp. E2]